MKPWMKWTFAIALVGTYVACSPKQFSKDSDFKPCQESGQSCIVENGRDHFEYAETIEGGKVDVLVVTDNSASMSFEQARLADRFSGFIANLDGKHINYRIGVVTSDISDGSNGPRSANQQGALQDGKLIAFSNGAKYLSKESGSASQIDQMFKATVQRPETLACENFITTQIDSCQSQGISKQSCMSRSDYINGYAAACPSGDERGIYAAHLALAGGAEGMIRSEADLALIILSDEDVRSALYYGSTAQSYPLDSKDKADGLIAMMAEKYPQKTYAAHSIIVRHGDTNCLNMQNGQTRGVVSGSYGVEYDWLRHKTGGVQGNICASDYAGQLQNIFDNIQSKIVDKLALYCATPDDLNVTLENNSDSSITWTVVDKEVRFNKKLPVGTTVRLKYSCLSL